MPDLDLNEIEEVPAPQRGIPMPPVEERIHQAALAVQKHETPQGTITLLQFITPAKAYVFQLDDEGCENLINSVRPSAIKPATLLDLPPGVRG